MPKVNHYNDSGELSSCGLCHQLSDHVRQVKVTYHICSDCKLQDYEVIKKGTQSVHVTKPNDPLATGGQADAAAKVDPATFVPPPRVVPRGIASQFKPDGYVPQ